MKEENEIPSERRSCCDCRYCRGCISLWCINTDTIRARGTRIPGVIHCPYWKREARYDDGWGFEIPNPPFRVLRVIRIVAKRFWRL